jgi:hypothetical protein
MNRKALVGLLSGVSLVIATLVAVALLNMPVTANAARSSEVTACSTKGAMDRSYGLPATDAGCAPAR